MAFQRWLGERALGADYDTVTDPEDPRATPIPVVPDAYFVLSRADLHQRAYFLEVDLGTANLGRFRRKVRGYELCRGEVFRRRYGLDSFTVVVVAGSPRRLQGLEEAAASAAHPAHLSHYVFGLTELLRPESLLAPRWRTAAGEPITIV